MKKNDQVKILYNGDEMVFGQDGHSYFGQNAIVIKRKNSMFYDSLDENEDGEYVEVKVFNKHGDRFDNIILHNKDVQLI